MRIAVGQIDPVVGAFEANVGKIKSVFERACAENARVLITPELGICGYPPHDLMDRPEMFERNERGLQELAAFTRGKACALAVGHVARNPSETGRSAQNKVTVLENGQEVFTQAKTLLPTYDVFDEARYFEPAKEILLWTCDGTRVALAICEDLWGRDPSFGRRLYGKDPIARYHELKAQLVISLSASPYVMAKQAHREDLHRGVVATLCAPLIYVNQMGATDEILFDGASFAMNSQGRITGRLPAFRTSFGVVDTNSGLAWDMPAASEREDQAPSDIEVLTRALVTGIREYFSRTGFKTAILGLSGGIDSALVATLAAQALGPRNVLGVAMPSQFSSGHSLEDAQLLAHHLGILFEVKPIKFLHSTAARDYSERRGELAPLAMENLQTRLRALCLMTLSNHHCSLVLTTGNKSELAQGYCTLYGDMCGALAPLGDLFKTRVYEVARHANQIWGKPIPERSFTKPPSAELKPNQTDQDTLPPYEILDPLLEDYIEKGVSVMELEKRYAKSQGDRVQEGWIRDTLKRLELNEYKRRQAAPVIKISPKAFGVGRRIPIAKFWDQ